ncbi:putative phage-associated protein [Alkalibacillus filiformis]|uniref:Phage-associated protein n=1 Tax=Alkalibacillus filiformis TaxID=200990 RepID=A0ABU0DX60_9BACI|nr:type II toxin-antitoxin system antitoxin SocA domain-containing protein [Alkalibacillus filiformis]MDQ0353032.1 putative phage-associated protein [Alkalibacillus filiformis]
MFEHFILLHSDYSEGKRIAFHQVHKSVDGLKDFKELTDTLKSYYPELSFGFHHVKTDAKTWESVVEYDKFFEDVFPANDFDSFMRFLADDDEITSFDIANLITSKIECTHLKLQKLLYFFYEGYVKKYAEAPFKEQFVAWRHGPVIEEVYDTYKKYGGSSIMDQLEDDTTPINQDDEFKLSVYSRFMQTSSFGKYLDVLDETLTEYKKYKAWDLVHLTHQPGTPWDIVTEGGKRLNRDIDEDLIKEYVMKH